MRNLYDGVLDIEYDQDQKRLKLTIRGGVENKPNPAYHGTSPVLFEGTSNGIWLTQNATQVLLHDLQKMTRPESVSEIPTNLRLGDGATTFEIISPESRASEVENQIVYNTSLPGAIEHNRRVIAAAIRAAENSIGENFGLGAPM